TIIASVGLIVGAGEPPDSAPAKPVGTPAVKPAVSARSIPAREAVTRGRAAYDAGRLDEALAAFEEAARSAPTSAIPRHDLAAVLFRLGRYEEARDRYAEARDRADEALRTKIDYAMGNTALALGDVTGAIAAYDACIASTAGGDGLEAVRQDAEINRKFAYE